jgi:hypothetical protein
MIDSDPGESRAVYQLPARRQAFIGQLQGVLVQRIVVWV